MSNYIQPGTPTTSGVTGTAAGNPTVNANVGNYPVGANPLNINGPQTPHTDTGPGSWVTSDQTKKTALPQGVVPAFLGAGSGSWSPGS